MWKHIVRKKALDSGNNTCPYCGRKTNSGWVFCPSCGKTLPKTPINDLDLLSVVPESRLRSRKSTIVSPEKYILTSSPKLNNEYKLIYRTDYNNDYFVRINIANNSYSLYRYNVSVNNSHGTDVNVYTETTEISAEQAIEELKNDWPEESRIIAAYSAEHSAVYSNLLALFNSVLSGYSLSHAIYLSERSSVLSVTDTEGREKVCKLYLSRKQHYEERCAFAAWCRDNNRAQHLLLPDETFVLGETADGLILEADIFPKAIPLTSVDIQSDSRIKPVNDAVMYKIASDLTEGLCAIHDYGFAHLDIKPENCYAIDDHYVLGDFGSMRRINSSKDKDLHFTSSYASPELMENYVFDARSDIYSLCLTLIATVFCIQDRFRTDGLESLSLGEELEIQYRSGKFGRYTCRCRWLVSILCESIQTNPEERLPSAFILLNRIQTELKKSSSGDFVIQFGVLEAYRSSAKHVVIPDIVEEVGPSAFENCDTIESVILPTGVTSIGKAAFSDCHSLVSVILPDTLITVGDYAFSHCQSLKSIVIPDSVKRLGYNAFIGCRLLEKVSLSNKMTIIENRTFSDCQSLKSISIPNGITQIGFRAFEGCTSLTSVSLPDSVTDVSGGVFSGCSSLEAVSLSNKMTDIGGRAFEGCSSLKSITIPASVTKIYREAFKDCSNLTSVIIKNRSVEIGWDSFKGAPFKPVKLKYQFLM